MSTCEIGPNGGAGCDQDIVWLNGKWYSPHFEGSHWSRVKRTPKPKNEFSADVSDAEKDSLEAAIAKAKQ